MLTALTTCTGYGSATEGMLASPNAAVEGTFSLTLIGRLLDTSSTRLNLTAAQEIPEPATLMLVVMALMLTAAALRKRQAA